MFDQKKYKKILILFSGVQLSYLDMQGTIVNPVAVALIFIFSSFYF